MPTASRPQAAPRPPVLRASSLGLRLVDRPRRSAQPAAGDEVEVVTERRPVHRPRTLQSRPARSGSGSIAGMTGRSTRRSGRSRSPGPSGCAPTSSGWGQIASAYRLVFSEGDGLSGLTVDRYDRWLVAQFTSLALFTRRELILRAAHRADRRRGHRRPHRPRDRPERGPAGRRGTIVGSIPRRAGRDRRERPDLPGRPAIGPEDGLLSGSARQSPGGGRVIVAASACSTSSVSPGVSRSTRPGPARPRRWGSTARRPRSSWRASTPTINGIDTCRVPDGRRARGLASGSGPTGNGSTWSSATRPSTPGRPRTSSTHSRAICGSNLAALDVLAPDGILVTCSCSGLVGRELFADLIGSVAEQSGRPIQILEQRGQAPDHPVSASCLETEYLKCLICRVG